MNGGEALKVKENKEIDTRLKAYAEMGGEKLYNRPKPRQATFSQQKEGFNRLLEKADGLDEETFFYAGDELFLSATSCEERDIVNECLELLRQRHPKLYTAEAVVYAKWMITNDLLCGRTDRTARYFMEAAEYANRDIDSFSMIISCLAYFGELKTLLHGMRLAWPKVRNDDDIKGWEEEFAVTLCYYEICAHLDDIEGCCATEDDLITRLRDVLHFDEEYAKLCILQLSGRNEEHWKEEDSIILQKDPKRLTALMNAFFGYLRREEGVSCTKAKLAFNELGKYFLDRHAGNLKPKPSMLDLAMGRAHETPKTSPPEHGLCPDRITLDVYLSGLFHFMMPKPYDAAAFFSVIPSWLRFLESIGLLDAGQKWKTLQELKPLALSLVKVLEPRIADKRLPRDVAAAWTE